jgi:hypothetical protein
MIRKALEGPLRQVARNQEAVRRALEGPMAGVAGLQEATRRSLAPAMQQQRLLQDAMEGPLRNVAQAQESVRRALEGPLEQIRKNQEALAAAMAGPYAAIAASQDAIRAAMEQAAEGEAEEAPAEDEAHAEWLRQWAAAVEEWRPTWEQAEIFLASLSLLLALILFVSAGQIPNADLLEPLGILCAAGALVIRFTKNRD